MLTVCAFPASDAHAVAAMIRGSYIFRNRICPGFYLGAVWTATHLSANGAAGWIETTGTNIFVCLKKIIMTVYYGKTVARRMKTGLFSVRLILFGRRC